MPHLQNASLYQQVRDALQSVELTSQADNNKHDGIERELMRKIETSRELGEEKEQNVKDLTRQLGHALDESWKAKQRLSKLGEELEVLRREREVAKMKENQLLSGLLAQLEFDNTTSPTPSVRDITAPERPNDASQTDRRSSLRTLKRGAASPCAPEQKRRRTQPALMTGSPSSDHRTITEITDPVPGQLYIAHWSSAGWYAVVVLPINGSFRELGLAGSISKLFKPIPACYEVVGDKIHWAKGRIRKRYPVMGFDDDQDLDALEHSIPKDLVTWKTIGSIRPFEEIGPDDTPVKGYDVAVQWRKRLADDTISLRSGQPDVGPDAGSRWTVTQDDLSRLVSGQLNDAIINAYLLNYLKAPRRVSVQNSFFCKSLDERWTLDLDVSSYDYFLFPIFQAHHWSLAIVCHPCSLLDASGAEKAFRILTFNPVRGTHGDVSTTLKRHFCKIMERKADCHILAPGKPGVRVKVPQQTNDIDCGIFVLFFAEEFIFQPEEFILKALNREVKEGDWNFDPVKMRKDSYKKLLKLVTKTTTAKNDDRIEATIDDETVTNDDRLELTISDNGEGTVTSIEVEAAVSDA